jgi:glycosyltransferase involved in cell wall biosynthesis
MCQFPFDWARPSTKWGQANLLTYQRVLLNSEYSHGWYTLALERSRVLNRPCAPLPTVLYPPVDAVHQRLPVHQRPLRIVMLGRVFNDVQGKGHLEAIKAFRRLQVAWLARRSGQPEPPPLELYLVGAVMSEVKAGHIHQRYAERVKQLAAKTPNVHVLFDAPRRLVLKTLNLSRIVWSLTGFRQSWHAFGELSDRLSLRSNFSGLPSRFYNGECSRRDCPNPADSEHFGIAVTEAMSAGAIPVLLRMGGLAELVPSNQVGRLVANVSDIVASTLEVLLLSDVQLHAMSRASRMASRRFTGNVFHRHLKAMVRKGHTSCAVGQERENLLRGSLRVRTDRRL